MMLTRLGLNCALGGWELLRSHGYPLESSAPHGKSGGAYTPVLQCRMQRQEGSWGQLVSLAN